MEKPTRIKVICKNCGDAWEMPNIGVIPVMERMASDTTSP